MSFDAYRDIRDDIESALTDDLPAILSTVATEQSVKLKDIAKVYRHTRAKHPVYPSAYILPLFAEVEDAGAIVTKANAVVMVAISGSDPDKLDKKMDGYMTALVRLFAHEQRSELYYSVTGFDADQPSPIDGVDSLVQTGAVLLDVTTAEAY